MRHGNQPFSDADNVILTDAYFEPRQSRFTRREEGHNRTTGRDLAKRRPKLVADGKLAEQKVIRMAAEHKFKIGETVYLDPKLSSDAPGGPYQVIRRLPADEGEFQYVVRSPYDNHQARCNGS